MKKIFLTFILITLIPLIPSHIYAQEEKDNDTKIHQGQIINIEEQKEIEFPELDITQQYQKLKIKITKGEEKGKEITVENGTSPMTKVIIYNVGDKVLISESTSGDGESFYYITDYIRTNQILFLFLIFSILALLIGTKKGFFALLSMALSFVILFLFVLPQIDQGKDPVLITILASTIIIPTIFYLSHGFEKKTTIAVVGTFISLIITGILSVIFVNLTHLTGMDSEESMFLQHNIDGVEYNLKGLLLSGIILGTLGIMDDITISQTSIVYQLHDLRKEQSFSELFRRSLQIGKDHIASMINTLVLVYTGASMPLLLLFMNNPRPFEEIINIEMVSTEIVRTLVGSIGLILAVPITTYLACYFVKKDRKE